MHCFCIFLILIEFCSFEVKGLTMKFYQISTKDPGNIFLKWKMLRETTTNDLEVKSSLQLPYNWADKDTCGLEQLIG